MKRCCKCKTHKLAVEFYRNRSTDDGYGHWCKDCTKQMKKRYWQKGYSRKWQAANPEKGRAQGAVKRAVKAGLLPEVSTQRCQLCPKSAEHYHHHSYKKEDWLSVIPLCRSHHTDIHRLFDTPAVDGLILSLNAAKKELEKNHHCITSLEAENKRLGEMVASIAVIVENSNQPKRKGNEQ